jgi:hypothetical protein
MQRSFNILAGLFLAIGLALAGFFIGDGLRHIKATDRYVNVRGLAEREVDADTAHLKISIAHTGNDLAAIFPLMTQTEKDVVDFLIAQGLSETDIVKGQWSTDRASASEIKDDPTIPRYTVRNSIEVATHTIDASKNAYKNINDLRIKTAGGVGDADIVYSFTGLGPLRAEMIAAATKDARNAALQFAADSGSKVGSIRNASQGMFQIATPGQDSDDSHSVRKTVRVVTTVDYELKD